MVAKDVVVEVLDLVALALVDSVSEPEVKMSCPMSVLITKALKLISPLPGEYGGYQVRVVEVTGSSPTVTSVAFCSVVSPHKTIRY